jgi:hypothetical protein
VPQHTKQQSIKNALTKGIKLNAMQKSRQSIGQLIKVNITCSIRTVIRSHKIVHKYTSNGNNRNYKEKA